MPEWLMAGVWGLVAGSSLLIGAAIADLATLGNRTIAMLADTMIPEAFDDARSWARLRTVIGFLTAFIQTKLGG